MTIILIIGIIFIVLLIIVGTVANKEQKRLEQGLEDRMQEMGITISQQVKCMNGFIKIDEGNEKIYFVISDLTDYTIKEYSFSDILSCEVMLDDNSIYQKSTLRTVGGALVGGALLGGAGAIIGGLSGASQKKSNIKKAELKITVKDISNPNYKFEFYGERIPSAFRKEKLEEIEKWKDIISIIIDSIDKKNKGSR
ncbi:MAG: hypothetical protein ACTTI1_01040 [Prevotella intermedia]